MESGEPSSVDTYLSIAERVLRQTKRALSAHQILRIAYNEGVAPPHIGGRTQHKTLQARLSENILRLRDSSKFYRTAPGRFFLRELINDPTIPSEERRPIIARRRQRDLPKRRALAFQQSAVEETLLSDALACTPEIMSLIERGHYHYATSSRQRADDEVVVWSFIIVIKMGHVLSYRSGPYREDRDTFLSKRAIGFYTPVVDTDLNLFDHLDHGIVASGLKALASDLDLDDHHTWKTLEDSSELQSFVYPDSNGNARNLLALVSCICPKWFEPTTSRLAINDLQWLDLRTPINHHDDFDPWSKAVLTEAKRIALGVG